MKTLRAQLNDALADDGVKRKKFITPHPGIIGKKEKEVQEIISKFKESEESKALIQNIAAQNSSSSNTQQSLSTTGAYTTNFFTQSYYLSKRTLMVYAKNPGIVHVRIAMYSMMALLMGTAYWKIQNKQESVQDRISVLFFSMAFLSFMSISAFPSLIEDRLLFVRERANRYYRVGAYALAHTIISIPFILIIALSYSLIMYWMVDLNYSDAGIYFYFLFALFTALYVSESLVVTIAAIIPWYLIGIAIAAASYGLFMILNGYFVKATNIPRGWIWMHYLDYQKYAFEGFMINEFHGREIPCAASGCQYPDYNGDGITSGDEILRYYGYAGRDKWHQIAYLYIFVVVFRIFFYLCLRFFNKGRR